MQAGWGWGLGYIASLTRQDRRRTYGGINGNHSLGTDATDRASGWGLGCGQKARWCLRPSPSFSDMKPPVPPAPATIIVLNGASSSGKTTLAKAMQLKWRSPLHHVQFDSFRDMEPSGYWDGWERMEEDSVEMMMRALCGAVYAAVRQYAVHGQGVVLDMAATNPLARRLLLKKLEDLPVYLVAVRCNLDELVKREKERGDRVIGLAATQVEWIHQPMQYDFEVDTTLGTVEASVAELLRWLANGPTPLALNQMRARLHEATPLAPAGR